MHNSSINNETAPAGAVRVTGFSSFRNSFTNTDYIRDIPSCQRLFALVYLYYIDNNHLYTFRFCISLLLHNHFTLRTCSALHNDFNGCFSFFLCYNNTLGIDLHKFLSADHLILLNFITRHFYLNDNTLFLAALDRQFLLGKAELYR